MSSIEPHECCTLTPDDLSMDENIADLKRMPENRPKLLTHLKPPSSHYSSIHGISSVLSSLKQPKAEFFYNKALHNLEDEEVNDGININYLDISYTNKPKKIREASQRLTAKPLKAEPGEWTSATRRVMFFSTKKIQVRQKSTKCAKKAKISLKKLLVANPNELRESSITSIKNLSPRGGSKFANYWEDPKDAA